MSRRKGKVEKRECRKEEDRERKEREKKSLYDQKRTIGMRHFKSITFMQIHPC